jgi:hypothetical protein
VWGHSRYGGFRVEENLLSLSGFEPRLIQPVFHSLYQLRYPVFFTNLTVKDEAQTALFKDPVRTAL